MRLCINATSRLRSFGSGSGARNAAVSPPKSSYTGATRLSYNSTSVRNFVHPRHVRVCAIVAVQVREIRRQARNGGNTRTRAKRAVIRE